MKEKISELDTQIKYEDHAWDAIQGELSNPIPEEDHQCDHMPDLLEFIATEERLDFFINIYKCLCCGEEVEECCPIDEPKMA